MFRLGNGNTLTERLEALDLDNIDEGDTCSTDEMRDRLRLDR